MKIQSHHTISFMSLCSVLGILGMLIFMSGIEPEGLEPRMAWNGKDIALRLAIHSQWDGKVQERMPAVKVIKKDKGTVITVRSDTTALSMMKSHQKLREKSNLLDMQTNNLKFFRKKKSNVMDAFVQCNNTSSGRYESSYPERS